MLPARTTARALRRAAAAAASSRTAPRRRPAARAYATQQPNPTARFYKTFTRPVAKALLVAVLTYQLAYWGWVKLETDEVRAETDATIAKLEGTVKEYGKSKAAEGSKSS